MRHEIITFSGMLYQVQVLKLRKFATFLRNIENER